MEQELDYISLRLPKKMAEQVRQMNDNYNLQLEVIKQYFDGEKSFIRTQFSEMDESVLSYRAYLLKIREAFAAAQNENNDKHNAIWEEIGKGVPSLKEKVGAIMKELLPLQNDIQIISKAVDQVSTYKLENMLKIVKEVRNMSAEEVKMFTMLAENFKNPQP
jgi:hypothetical protein